jgi:hypothetical protein
MSTRRALTGLFLTALAASACGLVDIPDEPADSSDQNQTSAPDQAVELAHHRLARLLTGTFDSAAQAEEDPRYFAISLLTCRVDAPDLGELVLYVEQAMMGGEPYRQRLYVVIADEPIVQNAHTEIYTFLDPGSVVGLCDRPGASVAPQAAELREGCDVQMSWDGERMVGGTVGDGCASELNGARYATSEVTLTEDWLDSWDRGFDASGTQVWGAQAGPYRFDRR